MNPAVKNHWVDVWKRTLIDNDSYGLSSLEAWTQWGHQRFTREDRAIGNEVLLLAKEILEQE